MSTYSKTYIITGTTPAAASTAVVGAITGDLSYFDAIAVKATLAGATGGTLDVYLQTSSDDGTTWDDYAHYTQIAGSAAATVTRNCFSRSTQATTPVAIGSGLSPALAANTFLGGEFGDRMRCVCAAGVGTSAGAAITIRISGTRVGI